MGIVGRNGLGPAWTKDDGQRDEERPFVVSSLVVLSLVGSARRRTRDEETEDMESSSFVISSSVRIVLGRRQTKDEGHADKGTIGSYRIHKRPLRAREEHQPEEQESQSQPDRDGGVAYIHYADTEECVLERLDY